ncbi:phosphatase PAP2 family protein [Aeromonas veronii]|uniref:phosphatase PAP2 family protein n=1 Tax=Aeromonas TaxID=642 RepID=UPI0032EB6675
MPTSSSSLPRRQVLRFSAALILPLALLACLPWHPFLSDALQSAWLWWPYALSRMVDIPGIAISTLGLVLLTRHKLTLSLPALLALCATLFAVLAGDWLIKSLIKQLTEEPRPYLLWLAGQNLIPDIRQFYEGSSALRTEQVHAASQLLALPAWLGNHWQGGVNYAFPSGHSIAAISLAQFFGLIWLARAPSGAWLLPLWALAIALSRTLIGMHWPLDVLASALLGSVTALLGARWWLHRY